MTLYWRMAPTPDDPQEIILCSEHALDVTNVCFTLFGMEPAESMEEAAAVIAMILALEGQEDANTFLTHVEGEHECEGCAERATMTHNSGDDVSPEEWKERYMK